MGEQEASKIPSTTPLFRRDISPDSSKKCECISKLFAQIVILIRKRSSTEPANTEPQFGTPALEQRWANVFIEFILGNLNCTREDCVVHNDDMLWYVPTVRVSSSVYIGSGTSHLQVFRRQSRNKPMPGDPSINWQETVCLNVILQQLDYFVTCAVCTKISPNNLQILRKNCQRVYPSPSRRRMDAKGECEEITYPKIYFAIDSFDEVFSDVIVSKGECVCVELIARDRYRNNESVIFLGSIRYDVLKKLYDSRSTGTWNWAQKLVSAATKRRFEFVKMRGPRGKGFAEMAVARVDSYGFETPMSESGFDFRQNFDSNYCSQRRMSETGLFSRLFSASTRRSTALTPGMGPPLASATPNQFGQRYRRFQSDSAENVHQDSDLDEENPATINGGGTTTPSVWSVRGLGQALQFMREKPDEEQLNAYLTYITLPWISILEDILVPNNRKPILTFDLFLSQVQRNNN